MRRIVLSLLVLLLPAVCVHADEIARLHRLVKQVTWSNTPPPTPADFNPTAARTFNVTARQWSFSPRQIVVNEGDSVTLNISVPASDGSTHGFFLDHYMDSLLTINRGQTQTINFIANEPGTFSFLCTFDCGIGHSTMNGSLMVNSVAPAPPTITSFIPVSGPTTGGTVVAITGTNFQTGATVKFGDTNAVSTTVNSETSITAINPARPAGAVAITVTNANGQSATSSSTFTYRGPAPAIASFSPTTGPAAGGTVVTILGSNYVDGASVRFGSLPPVAVSVVNSSTITATTPAQVGSVAITVTNPDGQSATTTSSFTYTGTLPKPARRRAVRR